MNFYTKLLFFLAVSFFSLSSKSQSNNLITQLNIDKSKLSVSAIYFENYLGKKENLKFSYGESIVFRFEGLTGFLLHEDLAFPNMDIIITDEKGNVIYKQLELLDEITKGYKEEELHLRGNITFAKPMLPNINYILNVNIKDKKSSAYLKFNKKFKIENSSLFETSTNGMTYDKLYLYSKKRDLALIDNRISPNEKVYILLEGLQGYETNNGKAILSVNLTLEDSNKNIINQVTDMLPKPVDIIELRKQLYAEVSVFEGEISNPVNCTIRIKDRLSDKEFKTSLKLIVN